MNTLYERLGGHDGIYAFIKPFYDDVRQHSALGPIFINQIENWPKHLLRITEFWARQMGGPSKYDGGFAGAHLRLNIPPGLIAEWLQLFQFNCQRQLSEPESSEMYALAERLGSNLQRILDGGNMVTIERRSSE